MELTIIPLCNLVESCPTNHMHSDSQKRRSFVASILAVGDAKR